MKKLFIILIVLLFSGCAIASHNVVMKNGTTYSDKTYRLFNNVSATYTSPDGSFTYSSNPQVADTLTSLSSLMEILAKAYANQNPTPIPVK
jgi:hypothetical protein